MSEAIQQLAKLLEESGAEMVFRHSDVHAVYMDLQAQLAAEIKNRQDADTMANESIAALSAANAQLAAERAKVALAVEALEEAKKPEHHVYIEPRKLSYVKVIEKALASLQSTNALAENPDRWKTVLANEDLWDQHAVRCGNCSVEMIARKGQALSDPCGEDESLCGYCAGEQLNAEERKFADIRREVSRECVKGLRSQADEHAEWAADLICDKFGVKE